MLTIEQLEAEKRAVDSTPKPFLLTAADKYREIVDSALHYARRCGELEAAESKRQRIMNCLDDGPARTIRVQPPLPEDPFPTDPHDKES